MDADPWGIARLAESWADWMLPMAWQVALLAAAVWVLTKLLRRSNAALRHALWLLVFVKLVLPPSLGTPWSAGLAVERYTPATRAWLAEAVAEPEAAPPQASPAPIPQKPSEFMPPPNKFGGGISTNAPETTAPEEPVGSTPMAPAERLPIPAEPMSLTAIFFGAWALGAMTLLALLAFQYRRHTRRLLREAVPAPEEIMTVARTQAARFGLTRVPEIRMSPHLKVPCAFGFLRPWVILPEDIEERLTSQQQADLIAHEFAHIKRRDLQTGWVASVLLCLYWFHPAVWLANLYLRREREMACDDKVLYVTRRPGHEYASTMVRLAEGFDGALPAGTGFQGLFEIADNLLQRIRAVADGRRSRRAGWSSVLAVTLFALALVPMGTWVPAFAQTPDTPSVRQDAPPEAWTLLEQAEKTFRDDRFEEAMKLYEQVHAQYPNWNYAESALMMIGICHERLGRPEQAVEAYRQAIREYPDLKGFSESTCFYLGSTLGQLGQKEEAVEMLRKCVALCGESGRTGHFPLQTALEELERLGAEAQVKPAPQPQATVGPPRIVSTVPAMGATEVDASLTELKVTFDQEMAGGFSWTGGGEAYPELTGKPFWSEDRRTCTLPVKLQEAKYYRVGINSKSHKNFKSATGVPVRPQVLAFTTKGASPEDVKALEPPQVVSLTPENGASGVSPTLDKLVVTFDKPMGGGFSWTGGGEAYPETTGAPSWNEDRTVCTLPVKLKPNWSYRLGLNSPSHINFQSEKGIPLEPVEWRFQTGE